MSNSKIYIIRSDGSRVERKYASDGFICLCCHCLSATSRQPCVICKNTVKISGTLSEDKKWLHTAAGLKYVVKVAKETKSPFSEAWLSIVTRMAVDKSLSRALGPSDKFKTYQLVSIDFGKEYYFEYVGEGDENESYWGATRSEKELYGSDKNYQERLGELIRNTLRSVYGIDATRIIQQHKSNRRFGANFLNRNDMSLHKDIFG